MSTARAFLRPVRNRPNLHVILNATVTKIIINSITKTAEGVEFLKNGFKQTASARKEVILAAGAINSPQLLLLSGIGPKEDLFRHGVSSLHDLRGVGKNLHNHVAVFINFVLKENSTVDLDWAAATHYMLERRGPLSGTGLSQVHTSMPPSSLANSIQLSVTREIPSCLDTRWFPTILRIQKVQYRIHESSPPVPILSQANPGHHPIPPLQDLS
jgi:choline dehydrogenase